MDTSIDFRRRAELEREALYRQADAIGQRLIEALNDSGVEGGGWAHQANPSYYLSLDLHHPRGLGLSLRQDKSHLKGPAGRMLSVGGVYPNQFCGHRAEPVRVGSGTPASHMARRITRYLLPDYLRTLDVALAQEAKARLDEQARRALNRQMEQVLPALHGPAHEARHHAGARTYSYWYAPTPYAPDRPPALSSGKVRLSTDGSQAEKLELTGVPRELLLQILALVNPSIPVEGRIVPRAIAPTRRVLSTSRIIPGEVVPTTASQDGAQPEPVRLAPRPHTAELHPPRGDTASLWAPVLRRRVDAEVPSRVPPSPAAGQRGYLDAPSS